MLLDRRSEEPMKYLPSDRLSVCPFLDSFFRIYKFSDILHGFMVSSNLKSGRFGWFKNNLVLGFSGQKDESKWGFSSFMKNHFVEFFWYFVWRYSTKRVLRFLGQTAPKQDENEVFQVLWNVFDQNIFHIMHSDKVALGLKMTLTDFSEKILLRRFWVRSGRKGPKMSFF